jgi:signal transduction histidine kinase
LDFDYPFKEIPEFLGQLLSVLGKMPRVFTRGDMRTLLILDDEPDVRELLVHAFRSRGFIAFEAATGIEALALARMQHPDVVIADILMPVIDGFEFVRLLREDPAISSIPVIFHTGGYRHEEAVELAHACGVTELISKPAEVDAIFKSVDRVLGECTSRKRNRIPVGFDRQHLRVLTNRLARDAQSAHTGVGARVKADRICDGSERTQSLPRELLNAQEQERRRIARELHDEVGQALTTVKIQLQAMTRRRAVSTESEPIEECIAIIERALAQVRDLSLDLRPAMLDDLGLVPAVRWFLDRVHRHAGLAVEFTAELSRAVLSPELETVCFRIIQEAVTNVMRHAQCQTVRITLEETPREILLVIRDDGVGFDLSGARARAEQGGSLGLLSMEDRASLAGGHLHIRSAPGGGCEVRADFPITVRRDRAVDSADTLAIHSADTFAEGVLP